MLVGEGLWQDRFPGEQDIVGRRISINKVEYTAVGKLTVVLHERGPIGVLLQV